MQRRETHRSGRLLLAALSLAAAPAAARAQDLAAAGAAPVGGGTPILVEGSELLDAGDALVDDGTAQALPLGGRVDPPRQLLVTDLRVIEDPLRTNPRNGALAPWTFQHLVRAMAGRNDPSLFAQRWLESWERDQLVNGQVAAARPSVRPLVLDPWLRASGGVRLDLARAPFKLLAIVNRIDLRRHEGGRVETAGEGRFVFGVLGPDGRPLRPMAGPAPGGFLVIFEYEMVARSMDELRSWAGMWAELGRHALGSAEYNQALERITRRFSDRGSAPTKPNGNALNQLRTNEISLAPRWELREFRIDAASGLLATRTTAATPGTIELNGTPGFRDLVNQNQAAILDGSFTLAPAYLGASSLSGPFQASDFPDFASRTFTQLPLGGPFFDAPWSAAGIASNEARHRLALNTCNGCHRAETGTGFVQVGFPADHDLPRTLRSPAALAGFLRGIALADPVVPATLRRFNDLERRRVDFERLLASFFSPDGSNVGPLDERHEPLHVH